MADAVFLLILFYSLIFGMRRGFYKEVVQTIALVVAIVAAKMAREPAGLSLQSSTGLPLMVAEVAAVVAIWVSVFFVTAVVGRLLLKKMRGKGIDDNLGESAESVADAIGGDTTKGPLTLLTDPIASKRGIFYWSDKILGGGLGLLKGVVTGYLLFGLIVYAAHAKDWESSFAESIEGSYATKIFKEHIETTFLNTIPEYRIVKGLDDMREIGKLIHDAERGEARMQRFVNDARLKTIREHPKVKELAKDPEVVKAWEARHLPTLLKNDKVREALSDPDLRKRVSAVEWEDIRNELAGPPEKAKSEPESE